MGVQQSMNILVQRDAPREILANQCRELLRDPLCALHDKETSLHEVSQKAFICRQEKLTGAMTWEATSSICLYHKMGPSCM